MVFSKANKIGLPVSTGKTTTVFYKVDAFRKEKVLQKKRLLIIYTLYLNLPDLNATGDSAKVMASLAFGNASRTATLN